MQNILESIKRKRNSVEFRVFGDYALFSDPITRPGGEKFSYQVPTYEAIKGIISSLYWKPTITWHVDAIRIMKPIQTESKGTRPIKMSGGNELAYYTYLKDVEYQVLAHFEWNEQRPELAWDRNEHKHHNIAKRSIKQGGRRTPFLGTSECYAYVEPIVFGSGGGHYDDLPELDFGIMFHGFDYPDETVKNELVTRLDHIIMEHGIIRFNRPQEVERKRIARKYSDQYQFKQFEKGINMKGVGEDELV